MRIATTWINDLLEPNAGQLGSYDSAKDPVVVVNFGGNVHMMVSDPDMIQDLLVQKNALYDKTGTLEGVFSKLMGESFLFSRATESWKAKRKACAHAFYKERLVHMIEVLKEKLHDQCSKWIAQIERDGAVEVDISQEFNNIFTRNIIHIAFGEDVSDQMIEIYIKTDLEGRTPMVLKTIEFGQAIRLIGDAVTTISLKLKVTNPLYRIIYGTTGKSVSFSSIEKQIDENCTRMRTFMNKYLQQRKKGVSKSTVAGSVDLLSLFFESPDVFTDEFIIDELSDFFMAATSTTQFASQTITGHFATEAASLNKVRAEFNELCETKLDAKTCDKLAYLKSEVNSEKCQDMTYLG